MLQSSIGLRGLEDFNTLKRCFLEFRAAGFDTFDVDLSRPALREVFHKPSELNDCIARAKELFETQGVSIYQAHAPYHPRVYGDEKKTASNMEDIRLSIPVAGALGVRYLIVHPIFAETWDPLYGKDDELMAINIDFYREIVALAAQYNVSICTENIFSKAPDTGFATPCFSSTAKELCELMNAVPGLMMCLDNGHAMLVYQDCAEMARAFGKRLKTLHLHGNNSRADLHVSPFEFTCMDWGAFGKALFEIGYDGSINLEAGNFYRGAPAAIQPAAYRYLNECTQYIASLVKG